MSKPKLKVNDAYTDAEAEALIAHLLNNLARIELAVTGQSLAMFQLASMGAARCSRIADYNTQAVQLYQTQKGMLDALRKALAGQAPQLAAKLPREPREPVMFANSRDTSGRVILSCQPNEYPDPSQLRMFGKLIQGECPPAPGDMIDNSGQPLKGFAAICATNQIALMACGISALTAVALGAIGGKFLVGALREIRLILPGGSDLEQEAILAELDRKRTEQINKCVSRELSEAKANGQTLNSNDRAAIADQCERQALKAFPNRGRRLSMWIALIPVTLIVGTVAIVYFVKRSKKGSRAMVTT